jgi:hypothetical protein
MVDKARKVDVDASMANKTWSPDDFLQVLSTHTEQVRSMGEWDQHHEYTSNVCSCESAITSQLLC